MVTSPTAVLSTVGRLCPDCGGANAGLPGRVAAEALEWVGTPYRHQGHRKGVGCDCLGLVRGIWRAIHSRDLEEPGAYAADWAEAGGEERLLVAARRHFREKAPGPVERADLLLFRWRPHLPVKHLGIAVDRFSFVHAYEGAGAVVQSALVPQWRKRIAAIFTFPDSEGI
jgi:NlpC/P60 family putative phage cell wall peptidase